METAGQGNLSKSDRAVREMTQEEKEMMTALEQIHALKVLQERNTHYYRRLVDVEAKLSLHEHYMRLTQRLMSQTDRCSPSEGEANSHADKVIASMMHNLQTFVNVNKKQMAEKAKLEEDRKFPPPGLH